MSLIDCHPVLRLDIVMILVKIFGVIHRMSVSHMIITAKRHIGAEGWSHNLLEEDTIE